MERVCYLTCCPGLLNINTVPKIWLELPDTVRTKLLALMRKVSLPTLPPTCANPMACLQLGLAFPVYLTNDQSQSVPGLLIPSLLPDRDVEVDHVHV